MPTDFRYDRGELKGNATRTDEGYVRGEAIVTRTGVFQYQNADGSIRRELRHPDDVFQQSSLKSLRMIPITDGHPSESRVDASNASRLSIGNTGENVSVDGRYVLVPLTITHKDGVNSIEGGRVELSLGYRCDLEPTSGEYNGERYDFRQRNISYNHLALVDTARAGSQSRINLDGNDAMQIEDVADGGENKKTSTRKDQSMPDIKKTVVVRLDGIDYEASPEVERELAKQKARLDEMSGNFDSSKKESEKLQAKLDEANAQIETLKNTNNDEAIAKAVNERIALVSKAVQVVSEKLDGLSSREIMEKVIISKHKEMKLDGKSDEYVEARFDAIIDSLPAKRDDGAVLRQVVATAENLDGKKNDEDLEEKKKDAFAAMQAAHKNKEDQEKYKEDKKGRK